MCKWYELNLEDGTREIECAYCGKRYKRKSHPNSQMTAHMQYCKKLIDVLPIYDVPETGCGHWTDTTGEDNHSRKIGMDEATEILERIGTNIESHESEGDDEYYMIYDYGQDQGIPGLYIPRITYDYIVNYITPELGKKIKDDKN